MFEDWVFEDWVFAETHKRRMEEKVIFKEITEELIYTTKRYKNLSDDQFIEEWKENLSLTR